MKRSLLIAKHHMILPEHDEHIGMMIMPRVDKLQGHQHQAGIVPIELRPEMLWPGGLG
jgi:hypothetical protein